MEVISLAQPSYKTILDPIVLSCLKAVVLHVSNADVNKSLGIRGVRCSLYFSLISRAICIINTYKNKSFFF